MARPSRTAVERIVETSALLVRRVDIGDYDVLATFFTRERGAAAASARRARAPKSRLGPIEPLHTLRLRLELTSRSDVARLKELAIVRPRLGLVTDPARLDAASRLLRWVRSLAPPNVPEPAAYDLVEAALDRIDETEPSGVVAVLAVAGLSLASAFGYRLELESCVSCGTPCPSGASAFVDPVAGGVVCRACGGGGILLRGAFRDALGRALRGEVVSPDAADADIALDLAERTIAAHARPQR